MPSATFVLSTGRCGTQWLAGKLGENYGDLLTVEHEPLHNSYEPRGALGLESPLGLGPEKAAPVLEHLDVIERCLERRDYVECGHPCWSTLPFMAKRFVGRVRIIHLVRHPIPTSLSWLTHSAYEVPLAPHLQEKVLLSPFDAGVAFPEYRERWPSMTAFEKCLYYWAEVNAFGLRFESLTPAPWHRIAFEELFEPAGLTGLLGFLGLPERAAMIVAAKDNIDLYRYKAVSAFPDLGALAAHPRFVEVAARLGYDTARGDVESLKKRYAWTGL